MNLDDDVRRYVRQKRNINTLWGKLSCFEFMMIWLMPCRGSETKTEINTLWANSHASSL